MNILIIYGTTEGQTRKIATFISEVIQKAGHLVTLMDSTMEPPAPTAFDAVILGASIHVGKHQSAITHYAKQHHLTLNKKNTAFFSVSLTYAGDEPESLKELEKIIYDFLEETGWEPLIIQKVAGALKYTEYDFFKKFIMRLISKRAGGDTDTSQDYEYTNWDEVENFVHVFLGETTSSAK